MGGHDLFFERWTHCLISVTKVPDMRTYQNEHNMYITSNLEKHLNGQQVLKQMKKWQALVNKNFDRSSEVVSFFFFFLMIVRTYFNK
jgi:hypothetical protein